MYNQLRKLEKVVKALPMRERSKSRSEWGGQAIAAFTNLTDSTKAHELNDHPYLTDVLQRLPYYKATEDCRALMRSRWNHYNLLNILQIYAHIPCGQCAYFYNWRATFTADRSFMSNSGCCQGFPILVTTISWWVYLPLFRIRAITAIKSSAINACLGFATDKGLKRIYSTAD